MKKTLFAALAMAISSTAFADGHEMPFSYDHVDAKYSMFSADESELDAAGFTLSGSYSVTPEVFVTAAYESMETDDKILDIDELKVDGVILGLGYHMPVDLHTDMIHGADAVFEIKQGMYTAELADAEEDFDVTSISAGLRAHVAEMVEVRGDVVYETGDMDYSETMLSLEGRYHVTPDVSVAAMAELFAEDGETFGLSARYSF